MPTVPTVIPRAQAKPGIWSLPCGGAPSSGALRYPPVCAPLPPAELAPVRSSLPSLSAASCFSASLPAPSSVRLGTRGGLRPLHVRQQALRRAPGIHALALSLHRAAPVAAAVAGACFRRVHDVRRLVVGIVGIVGAPSALVGDERRFELGGRQHAALACHRGCAQVEVAVVDGFRRIADGAVQNGRVLVVVVEDGGDAVRA